MIPLTAPEGRSINSRGAVDFYCEVLICRGGLDETLWMARISRKQVAKFSELCI